MGRWKRGVRTGLTLLALSVAPGAASSHAEESRSRVVLGLGAYDFVRRGDTATDLRVEIRIRRAWFDHLRPWLAVELTDDEAVYGAAGLYYDYAVSPRWSLLPSLGVGAYDDGSGKTLGHVVQFRSGLELSYRLPSGQRVGLAFSHISNARLGQPNPGTEILHLTWSPAPRQPR